MTKLFQSLLQNFQHSSLQTDCRLYFDADQNLSLKNKKTQIYKFRSSDIKTYYPRLILEAKGMCIAKKLGQTDTSFLQI